MGRGRSHARSISVLGVLKESGLKYADFLLPSHAPGKFEEN